MHTKAIVHVMTKTRMKSSAFTAEIDAMEEITRARQKAYKIERQLKIDRANADREINDIRLKAEDREKNNATERIKLLREAQKIEEDITNKEIRAKRILIQAQKDEMALGKNQKEDKDTLAQLQAELIKLDTKKFKSQRLLQTQITTAANEEKALKEQKINYLNCMMVIGVHLLEQ